MAARTRHRHREPLGIAVTYLDPQRGLSASAESCGGNPIQPGARIGKLVRGLTEFSRRRLADVDVRRWYEHRFVPHVVAASISGGDTEAAVRHLIAVVDRAIDDRDGQGFVELITSTRLFSVHGIGDLFRAEFGQQDEPTRRDQALTVCKAHLSRHLAPSSFNSRDALVRAMWAITAGLSWVSLCATCKAPAIWGQRFQLIPGSTRTPPAPPAQAPPRRPPPSRSPSPTFEAVDEDAQATALVLAAESGVPFCEECAKLARSA